MLWSLIYGKQNKKCKPAPRGRKLLLIQTVQQAVRCTGNVAVGRYQLHHSGWPTGAAVGVCQIAAI